jgi:hypothetical protein
MTIILYGITYGHNQQPFENKDIHDKHHH